MRTCRNAGCVLRESAAKSAGRVKNAFRQSCRRRRRRRPQFSLEKFVCTLSICNSINFFKDICISLAGSRRTVRIGILSVPAGRPATHIRHHLRPSTYCTCSPRSGRGLRICNRLSWMRINHRYHALARYQSGASLSDLSSVRRLLQRRQRRRIRSDNIMCAVQSIGDIDNSISPSIIRIMNGL